MESVEYIDRKTNKLITERTPAKGAIQFLYHNPFGELALQLIVKRKLLSSLYGRIMHSSWSKNRILPFVSEHNINLSEAQKPLEEFQCFNDFFIRKLKAKARPIANGFVSPADSKVLAFESVNDLTSFFVKGQNFTLPQYLNNQALAEKFENAILLIFRLAPNDYHRFHFPYDGVPSPSTKIKGCYYSVSPYAIRSNFVRVFCENKRAYTILHTKDKGDILISPVGATMVGSISHSYSNNIRVQKGDEMGYFSFGGSSLLLLVDPKKINIDSDLLENTRNKKETAVQMGEKIGF